MRNLFEKVIALGKFARSRTFAVGLLSAVLAFTVYTVSMKTHAVYIRDGEQVLLKFTMQQDPQEILEENGIATIAADVVDFSGFDSRRMGEIEIKRAFPVTVTADGETKTVMLPEGTVADAIAEAQVHLDEDDEVNLDKAKELRAGDDIRVSRVEYVTSVEEEAISYDVAQEKTDSLIAGSTKVLQKGQDGVRQLTWRTKVVDGVAQAPELVSEEVASEPVEERVLVGTKNTVSKLDFGYTIENNVPVGYTRVISGAKATGYSAKAGAGTASGRRAMVGHVAVNPNVIPYGTKLYITSADGRFVYGYAIAADTGTALMDGRVDVDLFYDSYAASCRNGVKTVNIYILN